MASVRQPPLCSSTHIHAWARASPQGKQGEVGDGTAIWTSGGNIASGHLGVFVAFHTSSPIFEVPLVRLPRANHSTYCTGKRNDTHFAVGVAEFDKGRFVRGEDLRQIVHGGWCLQDDKTQLCRNTLIRGCLRRWLRCGLAAPADFRGRSAGLSAAKPCCAGRSLAVRPRHWHLSPMEFAHRR